MTGYSTGPRPYRLLPATRQYCLIMDKLDKLTSSLGYQDIANQITILDSAFVGAVQAYAENGTVLIMISLCAGKNGSLMIAKINKPFAPRAVVIGAYDCISSASDAQKVHSLRINDEGEISVWIEQSLSYSERISFH